VNERYRVELTTGAQKDLKSHRHAVSAVVEALTSLERNPEGGHLLMGDMQGIRSLDFSVKGSGAFRIAHDLNENARVCLVIAIGPRERFYERLRRRMKG